MRFYASLPVSQLGVMTYTDMTEQSPETQAAVEHEVRVLLKVCVLQFTVVEQSKPSLMPALTVFLPPCLGVLRSCQSPAEVSRQGAQEPGRCSADV